MMDREKKEKILDIIQSQKGKFVTVVFKKKDGTTRALNIQPEAGKFRVKGTGRKTPDHLAAVWDVKNGAFRSFPFDEVKEIRFNKQRKVFVK